MSGSAEARPRPRCEAPGPERGVEMAVFNPFADTTPLDKRGEWLSPMDIKEVFGVGRTTAYRVVMALPHIKVGNVVRVHKSTVYKALREQGCLPTK